MKTKRPGITYKDNDLYSLVYLDGKRVGRILIFSGKGFAYVPNQSNQRGEIFKTLGECKQSLQG